METIDSKTDIQDEERYMSLDEIAQIHPERFTKKELEQFQVREKNGKRKKMRKKEEIKKQGEEVVEHPKHYNHGKFECIDVIEDLNLNFSLGSCLKYLWRCGWKDSEIIELEKAKWYLEREIETRKARLASKS